MFKNLPLSTRIYAAQTTTILLLVVVGTLGIQALGSLNERIGTLVTGEATQVRLAAGAMQQLLSIADAEQSLRIPVSQVQGKTQSKTQGETQQERERHARLVAERKQVLQRSISELEPLTEGASLYNLQRFRELYQERERLSQELLTRSQQDPGPAGSTAADGLTDSRMVALQEAAERQLSAIVERAESHLAQGADSAEALYQSSLRTLLIVVAVAVVLGLAMGTVLVRLLNRRVQYLIRMADQIASGNTDHTEQEEGEDELSRVTVALSEITDAFRQLIEVAEQVALGRFERRITARSESDPLARAINQMLDNMTAVSRQADAIAQGDFRADIAPRSRGDQLGMAMQNMTRTLRETAEVVAAVATGNLELRVEAKGDNDLLAGSINQMVETLAGIVDQIDTVARGDYRSELLSRRGEDRLSIAMQRMTQTLQETTEVALAVANNDFSVRVKEKGEGDQLSQALNQMIRNLDATIRENEAQSWIQEGVVRTARAIAGEQSNSDLANHAVAVLCEYMQLQVGALYVRFDLDDQGRVLERPEYRLLGSYAYTVRKNLSSVFREGESLVGQAALENKPITVQQVPDDYVKVSSGLGEATPSNIVVYPFSYEGAVRGVVERGSIEPLNPNQQELLRRIIDALGIAFQSAAARAELDRALKESQVFAEELQTQQEELQETNEQLEEQTQALESSRQDIEDRNRRLEEAQQEINERAEQLEKSSRYKSEFLANMSHELRTPLNSILLLSKMIAGGDVESAEEQRQNASVIHDAGTDLLGLINEVLDLARIEAGKMAIHLTPISVERFVDSFAALFEPQAKERGVAFERVVADGLPTTFSSDQERLTQVLRNFLSNALKFTSSGGITLRAEQIDEGIIRNLVSLNGLQKELRENPQNYLAFSVQDSGVGIPAQKREVVFEAFQQADGSTSRTYGGTGLGLSISNQIADMLEGALALQSSTDPADHGSTFTIVVPITPSSALMAVAESSYPQAREAELQTVIDVATPTLGAQIKDDQVITSPRDERILLVVEDDPRFAETLLGLGRKNGYKVIHASTGTEGVRLAEQYLPAAILLDIQLPIMDGWGVLRHLKKNSATSHIPVHIVSVMDEEQFGLRLGAANYLRKPVDPQRLEEAFQHIEAHLSVAVRQLLVVEDNQIERNSIIQLLECERDVVCTGAASGKEALEQLRSSQFDAFILDLHLPDMSGYEVLQAVAADQSIRRTPAIVYTGKDLTIEEEKQLRQYAESIVLKTAESPARLLEEAIIFITATHRSAPASQQDQAVPDPLPAAAGARQKQPADGNAQSAAAAQW